MPAGSVKRCDCDIGSTRDFCAEEESKEEESKEVAKQRRVCGDMRVQVTELVVTVQTLRLNP